MRVFSFFILLLFAQTATAQPEQYAAKTLRAIQRFVLKNTSVDSIAKVITSASSHGQLATAKAVYDYVQANGGSTVSVTARLSGNGSSGSPLDIAQQSATSGQVLSWSGTAWVPSFGTPYTYVVATSTITSTVNTVLIGTLPANIILGLPTCDATTDGKSFLFQHTGEDEYSFTVDPASTQIFNDDHLTKTIYASGVSFQCTCRYASGAGKWFFNF